MGIIVAAFAGTGKTYLGRQYPDKILDLECMPYKYNYEPGTVFSEKDKATIWDISDDWPYNYVKRIQEVVNDYEIILIPPDMLVLELLRFDSMPYILVYPNRQCRDEYKERFILRGNQEEFIYVFIDGWDRFIDAYEKLCCTARLTLDCGEFLTYDKLERFIER